MEMKIKKKGVRMIETNDIAPKVWFTDVKLE